MMTHNCRRCYTHIKMPKDDLNRNLRLVRSEIAIPLLSSLSLSLAHSLHIKCACFGAMLRP